MATTNNDVSRIKLLGIQTKNNTRAAVYKADYLVKSFLYRDLASSVSRFILDCVCGSFFFSSLVDALAFAFLSPFPKLPPRAISITAHLLGYIMTSRRIRSNQVAAQMAKNSAGVSTEPGGKCCCKLCVLFLLNP